MAILTVRGLDPHVQQRLRERAARHGRSMEAEARAVLTDVVLNEEEPLDLAAQIRRRFADAQVELELPDRSDRQRDIELPA